MRSPAVSVLTTVYNREALLPACVDSVLASSLSNFEYIIVDDNSSDASFDIAQKYARADTRIRAYRNNNTLGDYQNRNCAAMLSSGKYLKYVDSDDVIYRHGLRAMVAAMQEVPTAGMGIERPPDRLKPYPFASAPVESYREEFLGSGFLASGPTAAIIRADAFGRIGGFSGERFLGDWELWLKLSARWPVVKLPQGLTWWRRHTQQEMSAENANPQVFHRRYCVGYAALAAEECPLSDDERDSALSRLNRRHARHTLALAVRRREPAAALEAFRGRHYSMLQFVRHAVQ